MADELSMSVAAWSPLAGGVLAGKFTREGQTGPTRVDAASISERDLGIAREVDNVADELGVSSSQVALAWTMARRTSLHPIIGARRSRPAAARGSCTALPTQPTPSCTRLSRGSAWTTYGRAGGLVLTGLIRAAVAAQSARYVAPGDNTWPNVHVDDLGTAFALALDNAQAGTVLNLVGGESSPREVTEAIGRLIGKPDATAGLPIEQARSTVPFADWLGTDQRVDGSRARTLLGWQPTGPTVIEDIEFDSYRILLDQSPVG